MSDARGVHSKDPWYQLWNYGSSLLSNDSGLFDSFEDVSPQHDCHFPEDESPQAVALVDHIDRLSKRAKTLDATVETLDIRRFSQ